MQWKGFEFIAFFLFGFLGGWEVKSEDVSTFGWMSIKVLDV